MKNSETPDFHRRIVILNGTCTVGDCPRIMLRIGVSNFSLCVTWGREGW